MSLRQDLHAHLISVPLATLCYLCISLIPPVATFLYFWGLEYWKKVPLSDRLWLWIVFISGSYAILFPPELPEYLSIMFGPGSVIHVIRGIELAFVHDVPSLKRLLRTGSSDKDFYAWESYPPPLTIRRGIWLIDLMTSIRGIGWSHGPRKHLPPTFMLPEARSVPQRQQQPKGGNELARKADRRRFLTRKAVEIILCYLWIDFYQSIIIRSEIWGSLETPVGWNHPKITPEFYFWLLTPCIKWIPVKLCIYATIQLSCSMLAFVDIGLGLLGNEPWQYPPVFGSSTGVMELNFQAIWGEWWHDLFRFTFLGVADWFIRASKAEQWEHILVLSIPFVFYAAIHASLSYAVSHDPHASALVVVFGAIQPLIILVQVRLRMSMDRNKKLLHDLMGFIILSSTFGLLLGNPGVLGSLASFPIPISVWRKDKSNVGSDLLTIAM